MDNCVFCKIIKGELPSTKVYEDDEVLAFKDIQPVAPVHILIIPKKHVANLASTSDKDIKLLGQMQRVAVKVVFLSW